MSAPSSLLALTVRLKLIRERVLLQRATMVARPLITQMRDDVTSCRSVAIVPR